MARRVLSGITAREFQQMAIHLIESGYDCSELHDLAWEPPSTAGESQALFDRASQSLGLAMPSRSQAVESILRFYAAEIVAHRIPPPDGLGQMMRQAYWTEAHRHTSSVYVGDTFDMQDFISSYYAYDDLLDSPSVVGFDGLHGDEAISAFDAHVMDQAAAWLSRHPCSTLQQ
jgi:hypothetical protein